MPHVVALPVCAGMTLLEYGTVVEALGFAWHDLPPLGYEVRSCGPVDGVRTLGGAVLQPAFGLDEIAGADTVIVTAVADPRTDSNPEWHEPLRAAAAAGARFRRFTGVAPLEWLMRQRVSRPRRTAIGSAAATPVRARPGRWPDLEEIRHRAPGRGAGRRIALRS